LTANWNQIYGKPLDLEFYMSNATDKAYTTQDVLVWQPLYFGYGTKLHGEPRLYGIRLRYNFGAAH